jgi:hypothetical protein
MGTKLTTVSVRLDTEATVHVGKAAQVLHQSKGAFLAQAGEEAAERVLLQWAAAQYTAGVASLSELAAETQLPLERIAQQVTEGQAEAATDMYLTSCRQLSRTLRLPQFYLMAKKALRQVGQEATSASAPQQER